MRRKFAALAAVLLLLAVGCGAAGLAGYFREAEAGKGYEELQEEARRESQEETAAEDTAVEDVPEEAPASEEAPTDSGVEIPIDFALLQEENPDIYAWITIPGTAVDYPIVQHPEDDSYYLDHTAEREEGAEGAIFTEAYNRKDFEDPNTVVYGHNMKNGTMFQSLHRYMDRSFFDENREILIYLPDEIRHYEIFAAYLYDSRHLLQSFDFTDKTVFRAYLRDVMAVRGMNAYADTQVPVTEEDKIITLSTCYKGMDTKRYLVQAVLVSIEKGNQQQEQ